MDNKLAISNPETKYRALDIAQIKEIAGAMVNAKMFTDLESANTAFVKILAGQEMGVPPFQAMSGIHIIKGRATLAASLLASKIMESGRYKYQVMALTDEICVLNFYGLENGKWLLKGESRFSKKDADIAGTQNMLKFPRNMMFARALSNGYKWYAPDALNGTTVYVEGEIADEPTSGEDMPTAEETAERLAAEKQARIDYASKAGKRVGVKNEKPTQPEVEPEPKGQVKGDPATYMDPIATDEPISPSASDKRRIMALMGDLGFKTDDEKHAVYEGLTGHASFKELTAEEAPELISQLQTTLDSGEADAMRVMFISDNGQ